MSIPALDGRVESNKFLCFNLLDIDKKMRRLITSGVKLLLAAFPFYEKVSSEQFLLFRRRKNSPRAKQFA